MKFKYEVNNSDVTIKTDYNFVVAVFTAVKFARENMEQLEKENFVYDDDIVEIHQQMSSIMVGMLINIHEL